MGIGRRCGGIKGQYLLREGAEDLISCLSEVVLPAPVRQPGNAVPDLGEPGLGDRVAGMLSIGIGLSSGAGPFALGALADATSTHTAFLVVPVLMAVALALLLLSPRTADA